MHKRPPFTRPTFEEACTAWKNILVERGLPAECKWLFQENLCFEDSPSGQDLQMSYQTRFTPPPPEAERIAYRYFAGFDRPVVFYRIGSSQGKSLCLLLCDSWFEDKTAHQGYVRRDEWLIHFYSGPDKEIEEVTDEQRWSRRVLRNKPVDALDFCLTIRAVHETLAHGRVLSPYEHYALKFLHAWKEFLPHKNKLDN